MKYFYTVEVTQERLEDNYVYEKQEKETFIYNLKNCLLWLNVQGHVYLE